MRDDSNRQFLGTFDLDNLIQKYQEASASDSLDGRSPLLPEMHIDTLSSNPSFCLRELTAGIIDTLENHPALKNFTNTAAYICLIKLMDEYVKNAIDAGATALMISYATIPDQNDFPSIHFFIEDNAGWRKENESSLPMHKSPYSWFDAFLTVSSPKKGKSNMLGGKHLGLAMGAHFLEEWGHGSLSLSRWERIYGEGDSSYLTGGACVTLTSSLDDCTLFEFMLRGENINSQANFIKTIIEKLQLLPTNELVDHPWFETTCMTLGIDIESAQDDLNHIFDALCNYFKIKNSERNRIASHTISGTSTPAFACLQYFDNEIADNAYDARSMATASRALSGRQSPLPLNNTSDIETPRPTHSPRLFTPAHQEPTDSKEATAKEVADTILFSVC